MATVARIYKTYELKFPIHSPSGETIKSISIRRMTLADREKMDAQGFNPSTDGVKIIKFLLHLLGGVVPEDLVLMDNEDYVELEEILVDLYTAGKLEKKKI